jgi:serine/threonine-protein kinase
LRPPPKLDATKTKPLGPTAQEVGNLVTANNKALPEPEQPNLKSSIKSQSSSSAITERERQLANFINQYDGGECFFLLPVALNLPKPKIEGYGTSAVPFQAFDSAFTLANKIEPDVGVRQVAQAQCPALTFLSRVRAGAALAPRLQLASTELRAGDVLSGTFSNVGNHYLTFLLISETGTVHNLSSLLRPEGELRRFDIPLQLTGTPGNQPELLVAIASKNSFDSLTSGGMLDATVFFPRLLSEIEDKGGAVGATALYFKLQR